VLDHDAPNKNGECAAALGSGYTKCGDITAFKIDSSTGRLSLLQDQQVATSTNAQATYFPIPSNPVDFTLASSTLLTLSDSNGEATATPYAGNYTGGNTVFPYTYSSTSGQLTVTSSGVQTLGSSVSANAIVYSSGGYVYVLDNEKTSINGTVYYSQIIPYTQGSNGSLQAQTGGPVGIDTTMMNPTALVVESKGKWAYVASASGSGTTNASSGISGYVLDTSTKQLTFMSGEPFGSGSGPLCIVEDPSDQFIYTVNYNDSTISGRILDQSSGVLNNISGTSQWTLSGPPTWAVMDGRTD